MSNSSSGITIASGSDEEEEFSSDAGEEETDLPQHPRVAKQRNVVSPM